MPRNIRTLFCKRSVFLLFMLWVVMSAFAGNAAKIYTPYEVPDLHAGDPTRFVIDPASYMSESARRESDATLKEICDSTAAEMLVVILPSIGEADINLFSKQLATHWRIGKGGKGLLVLFDMEGRQVRIHPVRRLDNTFTSIACHRIINEVIIPPMKTGDIDNAVADLSEKMLQVMTDPEVAAEIKEDRSTPDTPQRANLWYIMLIPIVGTMWVYSRLGKKLWHLRGKSDYEKARELYAGLSWLMDVVLCVVTLGLTFPILAVRRWCAYHYRNKPRKCDICETRMNRLSEKDDNKYLSQAQSVEEQLHTVDYDVWLCPECGATETFPFPVLNTDYSVCNHCHTKAKHLLYRQVERPATATRRGVGNKVYECAHCGKRELESYEIPINDENAMP